MIRIVIADDHTIVREGLKQLLSAASDLHIQGEAQNGPYVDSHAVRGTATCKYLAEVRPVTEVAMAMKDLIGYPNVAVYDGSWEEWGNRTDTKIETARS